MRRFRWALVASIIVSAFVIFSKACAAADFLDSVVDVQRCDRAIHIMAMLLVGFGFLMVFVKKYGRSALTATFLLVSVAIPLFSRNQGEIAASMATTDTIKARREATRRQVEAGVFAAFERVSAQKARADAFRTALVPIAVAIQGLAEESYRLGRDSILSALLAQRALRDVKSEYFEALLALQAAVADLEDILGAPIT